MHSCLEGHSCQIIENAGSRLISRLFSFSLESVTWSLC